jgi:LPXTG-site transpeptidase (sortase) family protein
MPFHRMWKALLLVGVAAIVVGAALVVGPLFSVLDRGQADQNALQSWNHGGSGALVGPVHGGSADIGKTTCGSSSPSDFALLRFDEPAAAHYAGVAGDGTWALLGQRSMVHYLGTPAPGQRGNVIIAFHREPDYEHIDLLGVGGTVTVQDRACRSFVYTVTQRWDIPPSRVTQLAPTSAYDMTLITCDPWWQDYNRLVWRLTLTSAPAEGGAGGSPAPAAPTNPSF